MFLKINYTKICVGLRRLSLPPVFHNLQLSAGLTQLLCTILIRFCFSRFSALISGKFLAIYLLSFLKCILGIFLLFCSLPPQLCVCRLPFSRYKRACSCLVPSSSLRTYLSSFLLLFSHANPKFQHHTLE